MSDPDLIQYAFFGHGIGGSIFLNSNDRSPESVSPNKYSHHKLADVMLWACNTYKGESLWKRNVSKKGTLTTLQGWYPTFYWSHKIHGED